MNRLTFEELVLSAAGDGGAASMDRRSAPLAELEDLLNAWSIERSRSIECEILLKLSRAAIAQLLAADRSHSSAADLRNLRILLRRIDSRLGEGQPDRA